MVIVYIVVANALEVLKCYGFRWCEPVPAQELMRLWQIGMVEIAGEAVLGGVAIKVWRRLRDKVSLPKEDRGDRIFNSRDLED